MNCKQCGAKVHFQLEFDAFFTLYRLFKSSVQLTLTPARASQKAV